MTEGINQMFEVTPNNIIYNKSQLVLNEHNRN